MYQGFVLEMNVVDIEPVFSLFRYFKQNPFGRPANNLKGIEALKLALGVGAPGQTSPDKGYSVRNFINMVPVLLNMLRPTGAAMAPAARLRGYFIAPRSLKYLMAPGCIGMGLLTAFSGVN